MVDSAEDPDGKATEGSQKDELGKQKKGIERKYGSCFGKVGVGKTMNWVEALNSMNIHQNWKAGR